MGKLNLDEISTLLFATGKEEESNKTSIIFGTALAHSENGEVLIKLDEPVYSGDDEDISNYEVIDDDWTSYEEEAEEDDDTEIVYWEEDDDWSVEEDDGGLPDGE